MKMEIKKTAFKNLLEIKLKKYQDLRGSFIKIFNKSNSKRVSKVTVAIAYSSSWEILACILEILSSVNKSW